MNANPATFGSTSPGRPLGPVGRASAAAWLALLPLAFVPGCASSSDAIAEAARCREALDYEMAYRVLESAVARHPDDPELEAQYWLARIDYLLHEGQQLVFTRQDLAALSVFHQVLALDPDNQIARAWRDKAIATLARTALEEGEFRLAAGELEEALRHFHDVLQYEPGNERALEGIAAVDAARERVRARAQDHYLSGVRALGDRRFDETVYELDIALNKDPGLDRARPPRDHAALRRAELRLDRALEMAEDGHHLPALLDLRQLRDEWPELTEYDRQIEWLEGEVKSRRMVERAEILALRGEHAEARRLLLDALPLTTEGGPINEKLLWVTTLRVESDYRRARDHELQNEIEQAIAAYREIEQLLPGWEDVTSRITDLESRLELAAKSFAAGQQAEQDGNPDEAIVHYRDCLSLRPRHAEAKARLDALTAPKGDGDGG